MIVLIEGIYFSGNITLSVSPGDEIIRIINCTIDGKLTITDRGSMTISIGYTCPTYSTVLLAPLPTTSPQVTKAVPQSYTNPYKPWFEDCDIKKEGKTPMRYNDNYACATVTAPQSDTAIQREYLLNRLSRAENPKARDLRELFNFNVDNTPKTYKQLIDAIKNDKFSINKKVEKRLEVSEEEGLEDEYFFGPLHGIIWDGPQADPDGFKKACDEQEKQFRAAKDVIMTADATAGLKALQDFEAWLPTAATPVQ